MQETVIYPVILHKDGQFTLVTIPDLPGGFTQGDDELDAIHMAQDAIGNLLADQATCPPASIPEQLTVPADDRLVYVATDLAAFRRKYTHTVRRNITLPAYLNELAKQRGINVSAVATAALSAKLEQ